MSLIEDVTPKQERNISLDMLRVIVMILIVLSHTLLYGKVFEHVKIFSINYYISYTVYAFIYVHVNCFVLLSGYFLSQKEFQCKRIFSLWRKILFWSLFLYIFFVGVGVIPFSLKTATEALFPFISKRYWFLTTYLLMYCLVPFLNAAISALSKKQYQIGLAIIFVIYIVLQNIFFWKEFTSVNSQNPLFFVFLYLIAGYLRKYPIRKKIPWFRIYVVCCGLTAISRFALSYITIKIWGSMYGETIFYSYNSVTMVIGSICLFMSFKNMRITKESILGKITLKVAPLTLGVYLIHEQPEMRTWLWSVLKPYQFVNSPFLIFILIGQAILVFGLCCLIEKIRIIIAKGLVLAK